MSYLLVAACIISTAQQAKPKVNGHKEPALAQPIKDNIFDDNHSNFINYNYCVNINIYLRKLLFM